MTDGSYSFGYGRPQVFDMEIAVVFGINEAVIINQIWYWMRHNEERGYNYREGRYWVRYTFEELHSREFPWLSVKTIKRAVCKLEEAGVLLSESKYNKRPGDRTKWYSVDKDKLDLLIAEKQDPKGQNDPMERDKMTRPLPEITTEITKNINGFSFLKTGGGNSKTENRVSKEWCLKNYPFVDSYLTAYYNHFQEQHPYLPRDKIEEYNDVMENFESDTGEYLIPDCIPCMAERFFDEVEDSDHNLAHFATEGILNVSFYAAGIR